MVQKIDQPGAEITLGYWALRGLGQPIRFLLSAAGVPFSELRLGVDPNGSHLTREDENIDWQNHRAKLNIPFCNLPYLIDTSGAEAVEITQSNVIMRYLGRRFDFYGDNASERLTIETLQEEAYDFRNIIVRTAYTLGDDYSAALASFQEVALPRYLDGFENYLAGRTDNSCFAGTRTSLVDFYLYEQLWQASMMVEGSITQNNRTNLFEFLRAFENQPQIAAYMASSNYIERPISSPWASFT